AALDGTRSWWCYQEVPAAGWPYHAQTPKLRLRDHPARLSFSKAAIIPGSSFTSANGCRFAAIYCQSIAARWRITISSASSTSRGRNAKSLRTIRSSAEQVRKADFAFARTTPAARLAPRLTRALGGRGRPLLKSAGQPLRCRRIRSRFDEGVPVPRPRDAMSLPTAGEGTRPGYRVVTSLFHHSKTS